MWTIIKFNPKKFLFLKNNLIKKFKNEVIFYKPKLQLIKNIHGKKILREINLLGDYFFCYSLNFNNETTFKQLLYTKGLKYFIKGHKFSQNEINEFISKCKKHENEKGFLSGNFFDLFEKKEITLNSGPFSGFILKVLELQKNKLSLITGNLKISTNKKNLSFV
tara:strand:+ start:3112 stop:3603 length:492 start_codon:yes stop_codon:yes gene_type:complete